MGEIADGLINGDFDFYTGEYIGRGFGFPRTHNKSLPWESRRKRVDLVPPIKNFTQSKDVAFKGVSQYLKRTLRVKDITNTVNQYLPESTLSLKQKCFTIQEDFSKFVKWINDNKELLTNKTI